MTTPAQMILDLLQNCVFLSAAGGWLAAQIIKALLLRARGETDMSRLLSGGGMPSSHTATVVGLWFAALLRYGFGSFESAISFFFMVMVVYDSLGMRYVTGQQNKILNHIITKEKAEGKDAFYQDQSPDFKELMGHTLPEVIVGGLVGIGVAVLVYVILYVVI